MNARPRKRSRTADVMHGRPRPNPDLTYWHDPTLSRSNAQPSPDAQPFPCRFFPPSSPSTPFRRRRFGPVPLRTGCVEKRWGRKSPALVPTRGGVRKKPRPLDPPLRPVPLGGTGGKNRLRSLPVRRSAVVNLSGRRRRFRPPTNRVLMLGQVRPPARPEAGWPGLLPGSVRPSPCPGRPGSCSFGALLPVAARRIGCGCAASRPLGPAGARPRPIVRASAARTLSALRPVAVNPSARRVALPGGRPSLPSKSAGLRPALPWRRPGFASPAGV